MTTGNKIIISALESGSTNSLTMSVPGGSTVFPKAVSEPDSTQSQHVLVEPENSRIILSGQPSLKSANVSVHDVAAFILQQQGEMTAMKLQKLVYYSQAWSLVWDENPLFDEPIEAWANGPVVRALYRRHQGHFKVSKWAGDPQKLSDSQRETITKVLEFYGHLSSQTLSDLTHQEAPWREAREGLGPTDRGSRIIELAAMAEYYSSL